VTDRAAIVFEHVGKTFSLALHHAGGIKSLVVEPRGALARMRAGRRQVLEDVSLTVGRGESLGVIGRNGAGKSTLLSLIAGVLRPTTGTVVVNGRVSPLLELGAGFHPELTGRDNIVLNGVLLGLRRAEVRERMDQIVAFSELEEWIDEPVRVYSTGMLARLGFSVAAHLDPEILLVDETLAVGDAEFKEKCMGKIDGFRRAGVTIVFVSHDPEQLNRVCDRAIVLRDHRLWFGGAVREAIARYESGAERG
jgi:lipopolysaccharide transport system ATP-binding protein